MGDFLDTTVSSNADLITPSSKFGNIMEMGDMHVSFGGENGVKLQYQEEEKFIADEAKSWYFTCWKQGDPRKVPIITFHDLGLNGYTCFRTFFNHPDMQAVTKHFSIYHLTAPGQEENAPNWREGTPYPTMDEMAEMIESFRLANGFVHFIGIGVGAGANILARYAIKHPQHVDALLLVNCTSRVAGWGEWTSQKWNNLQLKWRGMTNSSLDYLMWNYFNKFQENRPDLVNFYRQHFAKNVNPTNLALFIDSFINRTDLNIYREGDPARRSSIPGITCRVLQIAASDSPYYEETIQLNSRLYPEYSEWLKIQDADGFVLDEEPGKVAQAVLLQLQGVGYDMRHSDLVKHFLVPQKIKFLTYWFDVPYHLFLSGSGPFVVDLKPKSAKIASCHTVPRFTEALTTEEFNPVPTTTSVNERRPSFDQQKGQY